MLAAHVSRVDVKLVGVDTCVNNDSNAYCRTMLCISATDVVMRCMSVWLAGWVSVCHVRVLCRNGKSTAIVAMECE